MGSMGRNSCWAFLVFGRMRGRVDLYILDDDGEPVATDLVTWARWLKTADRQVLESFPSIDVLVSTVFLGLNHNFSANGGLPVLWETMIFGGEHHCYQRRYTSKLDALLGHQHAVRLVERSLRKVAK